MIKKYGYARVSTREQNLDRQLTALREYIEDERDIITDKESGKDFDRAGYQYLRERLLRPGDVLIVKSLDRLGRNAEAIKAELLYYRQQEIRVQIIDLPTTMTDWPEEQRLIGDMINNILIEVYSMIAEQERMTIRQRQAEGIAAAKARGVKFGRPALPLPDNFYEVHKAWREKKTPLQLAAKACGMPEGKFYDRAVRFEKGW